MLLILEFRFKTILNIIKLMYHIFIYSFIKMKIKKKQYKESNKINNNKFN